MSTLRKVLHPFAALATFCLCLGVLPAAAALPNGLQDVYTILTTGNPPKVNDGIYEYSGRTGGAQASWSSDAQHSGTGVWTVTSGTG
jgi:hypothetical protein